MPLDTTLLESLKGRTSRTGIVTADRYFREVQGCFDGGACPVDFGSQEEWGKALKAAESKLTYTNSGMRIVKNSVQKSAGGILQFDAVITTPKRDRDGDVLETKGARLDPSSPLLWQHIHMQPIGKMVRVLKQTSDRLTARFQLADTALGRDAAELVKIGALRISHGFQPEEWEPMEDEQGWLFKKFEIFEVSLVSIPSNTDAVITAVGEKAFDSELMRRWQKSVVPARLAGSMTDWLLKKDTPTPCGCKSHVAVPENVTPEPQDKRIIKSFDVERQHVEAAKLEYDWISRFCSCEVKHLVNMATQSARIRMGSFLTGLKHALRDSIEVDTRRLTSGGLETPLEYETIQLNSTKSDHFMVDGISFRKTAAGVCFAVKFARLWHGERVDIFCAKKDQEAVQGIIGEAWKWADANNFLKGEAFSLGGEFLPKTIETWGDLFLDHVNEREVKRTVDLMNAKGKACPNRGQIFMGPPGTGKTLSGRLMRNHADATFIWIGGKDAYYFGGVNAVLESFELAKELAPSIIFMEDIDASLDSRYATDVLKTEMDGIGRSTGITTVLTTNHPGAFPEALLDRPGRFHDVLKFDLPDERVRHEMLSKWLPTITDKAAVVAVKATDGYSGAHVYELCQYAKNLSDQDSIEIDAAVTKAIQKIADQRALIDEELTSDRRMAGKRRSPEDTEHIKSRMVTKGFSPVAGMLTHSAKSFDDIAQDYRGELALKDTDTLRREHRLLSLMLRSAEEQEEARDWDSLLSQQT